MKEILDQFIENLSSRIENNNYVVSHISDFCYEIKNDANTYTLKYESPCIFLEKSDKKICEWMLNQNSTTKDINCILDDFSDIINEKKKIKNLDSSKEEKKKNDDLIKFDDMISKILQFMPDIKDIFYQKFSETSKLSDKINFLKREVVPQLNKMIARSRDDKKLERLFYNLSKDYVFGDDDTRCIITMIIFNGITDEKSREKVKFILPAYMQKTWVASWRVR